MKWIDNYLFCIVAGVLVKWMGAAVKNFCWYWFTVAASACNVFDIVSMWKIIHGCGYSYTFLASLTNGKIGHRAIVTYNLAKGFELLINIQFEVH